MKLVEVSVRPAGGVGLVGSDRWFDMASGADVAIVFSARGVFGSPPPGYRQPTRIMIRRAVRSKWTKIACRGQRGHYRGDGGCAHVDALICMAPHPDLVRIVPFGGAAPQRSR